MGNAAATSNGKPHSSFANRSTRHVARFSMIRALACREGNKADFELPSYYEDAFNSVDDLRSTLDRILNDVNEQNKLMEFLKTEFAEELLECYRKIHLFQYAWANSENGLNDEKCNAAKEIVDSFLKRGAPFELNCSPKLKAHVVAQCNKGEISATIFDDVKQDIVVMIAKDKLRRFVEARKAGEMKKVQEATAAGGDSKPKQCARLSARYSLQHPHMFMSPDIIRGTLGLKDLAYPPVEADCPRPIPRSLAGGISCHGQDRGKYKINQDRALMAHPFQNYIDFGGQHSTLFVLADGHGPNGHQVADYVVRNIWMELKETVKRKDPDFEQLLVDAFEKADANLEDLDLLNLDRQTSGCTCVVALLIERTLYVASAGDAKIVMGYVKDDEEDVNIDEELVPGSSDPKQTDLKVIASQRCKLAAKCLTVEHKIAEHAEAARIEQAGGLIEPAPGYAMDRIWFDSSCRGPGLQPTRTIGDHAAKRIGVIATPETARYNVSNKEKFIILASDGVWEYVTDKQAVRFVEASLRVNAKMADRAELAAVYLMNIANKHWVNEGNGYADDISVTVSILPPWERL